MVVLSLLLPHVLLPLFIGNPSVLLLNPLMLVVYVVCDCGSSIVVRWGKELLKRSLL